MTRYELAYWCSISKHLLRYHQTTPYKIERVRGFEGVAGSAAERYADNPWLDRVCEKTVIRFDNVGKRYGAGPEILRDLTFALEPGSFSFLTGPSGAGKSTLLKLLFLAERPSRGLITLFGQDLAVTSRSKLPSIRRRIGVVFQEFRLLNHLSVFDNVALPLRIAGKSGGQYGKDVEELLTWVGLGYRIDAKPPTLSGGEQQRVAIARAVVAKPDLLLADEPTGNVDPEIGRRLIRLFVELNRFGTTVMIATHDRALVESTPARELRLVDGNLVQMPSRKSGIGA